MGLGVGEIVGDYRVVGVIGAGGSGEVYRVEHTITRQVQALKALSSGRCHPVDEEERFLREIQLQASLHHPNIASVHNAFFTPEGLALIMEFVEGEPLDAILARGRLPLPLVIDYVLQILAALRHAHARSILHRDVKPGNILITKDGTVKLTDFGLARAARSARLTQSGELAGSPYYMSPEQISDAKLDARTDLYSLGVVLYEMATGQRPFPGDSSFEVMRAHVENAPAPPIELEPAIGPDLDRVILAALAKDPADRVQSAENFQKALEAVRRNLALPPGESRRRRLPGLPLSRSMRNAVLVGVGAGSLILAAILSTEQPEPPAADAPPVIEVQPAPEPIAPPPQAAPAEEEMIEEAPPAPARAVPRRARRPQDVIIHGAAVPKPESPSAAIPERVRRDPAPAATPAETVPQAVPAPAEPLPAPPAAPAAAPASKKRGNLVLRTLRKLVEPWTGGDDKQPKPAASTAPK